MAIFRPFKSPISRCSCTFKFDIEKYLLVRFKIQRKTYLLLASQRSFLGFSSCYKLLHRKYNCEHFKRYQATYRVKRQGFNFFKSRTATIMASFQTYRQFAYGIYKFIYKLMWTVLQCDLFVQNPLNRLLRIKIICFIVMLKC